LAKATALQTLARWPGVLELHQSSWTAPALSLVGTARLRRPRRVPAAQREAWFVRKA